MAKQNGFAPAPAPAAKLGLAPAEVFDEVTAASAKKGAQAPFVTFVLGFSAGCLIAIGGALMTAVGGGSPAVQASDPGLAFFLKGAVGIPTGLVLVVLTGAELVTSNMMTMLVGFLQRTVKLPALLRNWALSYLGNFVGSVFFAVLSHGAHTLAAEPQIEAAKAMAELKATKLPFGTCVLKGIICNWLVCLAVWGAMASPSIAGKVLAIWLPISCFVALGAEHCVANMFLIPQGMLLGADVSVVQFLGGNILPVTIGNVVGACVFVAGVQYVAFGTRGKHRNDSSDDDSDDEP